MATIKKEYNSYEDFIQDNLGRKDFVLSVGSGGTSQPITGATKESLAEQFNHLILHNFLDHDFLYNHDLTDELKHEYLELVSKFYKSLINSPEEFKSFWIEYIRSSGHYDTLFEIQNPHYDEHGKSVEYKLLKHYPDYIFIKYKDTVSPKLRQEYEKFRLEISGKKIGENFEHGGSISNVGVFHSIGSAEELEIPVSVEGHDMIAVCECGEQFSYEEAKKDIHWQCPACNGMKQIS